MLKSFPEIVKKADKKNKDCTKRIEKYTYSEDYKKYSLARCIYNSVSWLSRRATSTRERAARSAKRLAKRKARLAA